MVHILTVPSWYPEHSGDLHGSFFPEQASTVQSQGHEFGVISLRLFPIYQAHHLRGRPKGIRHSIDDGIPVLRRDCIVPIPKAHIFNQAVINRIWWSLYKEYVGRYGQPDVMHVHTMFPAGLAAAYISRRTGVPFIVTEHRPVSIDRLREPGLRHLGLKAATDASALIAVSAPFAASLNTAYETDRWRAIPGLLSPQFEHTDIRQPSSGPFTFGHVSHLAPGKRVDMLIEAFSDAFAGDGSVKLRIAGDSASRTELERLAVERGVSKQVEFVGAVSRSDIVDEFKNYDVFVLPSAAESFGTVLWEALACGIPLVATRTWGGINSVTEENGLLVEIDDRADLARAMREIRTRFNRYDPSRLRSQCLQQCGREQFTRKYVEAYQEAAGR